jgi:hypothetical protein
VILSFQEEGNEARRNDYARRQENLANGISLLFRESLFYTERSFWGINYCVSFSYPELLEPIIRMFKMTKPGEVSMYV